MVRSIAGHMAILTALIGLVGGCAVGPDFIRPAVPSVAAYIPEKAPPKLALGGGEPSQHLEVSQTQASFM